MAVKAMPDGYHRVTPYLVVPGVATLLDFLTQAFEAHELHRLPQPDGTIIHAAVRIGDSRVMLGEPRCEAQPLLGALSRIAQRRTACTQGMMTSWLPNEQGHPARSCIQPCTT
jgi:PhnB protein